MRQRSTAACAATLLLLALGCTNPKPGTPLGTGGTAGDLGTGGTGGDTGGSGGQTATGGGGGQSTGGAGGQSTGGSGGQTTGGGGGQGPYDAGPDAPAIDGAAMAGKQNNGTACTADGQCASGYCTDGVCCGARCTGSCQACAQTRTGKPDGTCAPVTAGADPDNECPAQPPAQCGNLGGCDGIGACRKQPTTVSCATAGCNGNTFTPERHCDGAGQCAAGSPAGCGLFKCAASGCPSTCSGDGDCVPGNLCVNGACGGKRGNGAACTGTSECGSGFCVDGVCCGSACNGLCEACTRSKTGQADGNCQPIRSGEDPDTECGAEAESTCGNDGWCDGARACRKHGVSIVCATATCSGSTFTPARNCDGRGSCAAASPTSCGLARCNSSGCIGTCNGDQDCIAGTFCSGGSCTSLKAQGSSCNSGPQCSSGNCVDGFCCSGTCTGTCQACSQAKTGQANGTCASIPSGSDPDGECTIASDPTTCGNDGWCDGAGGCRKYGSSTQCASATCSGSTAISARTCSGQGTCSPATMQPCNSSQFCSGGVCMAKTSTGQSCDPANQHCVTNFCVDNFCCASACNAACQNCVGGSCNAVSRQRDPGTCEGQNWCVSGSCVWAGHWEDQPGFLITTYTSPFPTLGVGTDNGTPTFFAVNGTTGPGATSTFSVTFSVTADLIMHTNNCTGVVLGAGQKCDFEVWIHPLSAGNNKQGTVTMSDGLGHSYIVPFNYNAQ